MALFCSTKNAGYTRGKQTTAALLSALALLVMIAGPVYAKIYRWQDDNGTWHFSDGPSGGSDRSGKTAIPGERRSPANVEQDQPRQIPANSVRGGMLWKISRNGYAASYLLGTIHSDDSRVTRLRPEVAGALDNSHRFIMEMELNADALMQFSSRMFIDGDRDLESLLGSALFNKALIAMGGLGMPEMAVRRLKPWVVMTMLSMPKSKGDMILVMVLHQRASDRGISTTGLETAAEQLAVFDELTLPDQIGLLQLTLDQLPRLPQYFEQLIRAYASDDLYRITQLSQKAVSGASAGTARRFMQRLNDHRNRRMIERIIPYLMQGNSFIAVGCLHLAGPNGLLALLEKRGYRVESMKP